MIVTDVTKVLQRLHTFGPNFLIQAYHTNSCSMRTSPVPPALTYISLVHVPQHLRQLLVRGLQPNLGVP